MGEVSVTSHRDDVKILRRTKSMMTLGVSGGMFPRKIFENLLIVYIM